MDLFNLTNLDNYQSVNCTVNSATANNKLILTLINFQFYSTNILTIPAVISNAIQFILLLKHGTYLTRNLKIFLLSHVACSFILLTNSQILSLCAFLSRDNYCNLIIESYLCRTYTASAVFCVSYFAALLVCIAVERRVYLTRAYTNFDKYRYNSLTVIVVLMIAAILSWLQVQVIFLNILMLNSHNFRAKIHFQSYLNTQFSRSESSLWSANS